MLLWPVGVAAAVAIVVNNPYEDRKRTGTRGGLCEGDSGARQQPAQTLLEEDPGFSGPDSNERGVWLPNMAAHRVFYVVWKQPMAALDAMRSFNFNFEVRSLL